MLAVDAHGMILEANSQAVAMFGYRLEELVGQRVEMLVPERQRNAHHQHRETYAHQPRVRRMGTGLDLYGRRKDGSEFPVDISLSPLHANGKPLVLSAIRDITDRKRTEDELRRAHQELAQRTDRELWEYRTRLSSIVDNSEDAIISKDLNGIITSWNKGAERIYGLTAAEMLGKPIALLVPRDRPAEVPAILEKIRHGESVENYESVRITRDGHHINVSLSASSIRDAKGNIVGASAIAHNITAQKRAEEQLRQAQKMEAVGRLAGGVAHDFNNILGIITACTEFLHDRIETGSPASQYITNIRSAADRGAALTRQLMAFSRKQVVQPTVLDVKERLREITRLVRPLVGEDVEVVLAPRSEMAVVEIDPGQLDQIIINLAVNARDAMPHGGRLILETASMTFDQDFALQHPPLAPGKYVMLAVSDTGIGMDQATVSRIFEPFFTTKETGKGTGLGLATVYGIVKQSGGHIWVYSKPGQGTTFRMYLPSAEHKLGLAAHAEAEPALPRREGTTILLVEDDAIMRDLTRQLELAHGYHVIDAGSGQAALEQLAAHRGVVDLVLTDVVMQGMSGPEMVARLHATSPSLKVVFMSGYTGHLVQSHDFFKKGATLLEKPFTRTTLLKAIHDALS